MVVRVRIFIDTGVVRLDCVVSISDAQGVRVHMTLDSVPHQGYLDPMDFIGPTEICKCVIGAQS